MVWGNMLSRCFIYQQTPLVAYPSGKIKVGDARFFVSRNFPPFVPAKSSAAANSKLLRKAGILESIDREKRAVSGEN